MLSDLVFKVRNNDRNLVGTNEKPLKPRRDYRIVHATTGSAEATLSNLGGKEVLFNGNTKVTDRAIPFAKSVTSGGNTDNRCIGSSVLLMGGDKAELNVTLEKTCVFSIETKIASKCDQGNNEWVTP